VSSDFSSCAFEKLEKGAYLPPSYLEHKLKVTRQERRYRFTLMDLIQAIRLARPDLSAHIREEGDGLRIMHDAEAGEYNFNKVMTGFEIIANRVERCASINRNMLDPQARTIQFTRDQHMAALVRAGQAEIEKAKRDEILFGRKKAPSPVVTPPEEEKK